MICLTIKLEASCKQVGLVNIITKESKKYNKLVINEIVSLSDKPDNVFRINIHTASSNQQKIYDKII